MASFIPYSCQAIDDDDIAAVVTALRSEYLTQGPAVPAFEAAFARRHEVSHAVAVSNATSGLHLACLALGIGPGSRVWTSPNSFVASANCALYCGAEIDFVDIDPLTRNMCVAALEEKLSRAAAQGTLPALLIPVHFAGLPCDLAAMRAMADRHGFKILEDASHATGASYRGRPIGSDWADASVFSFHAVKVITTGEGGMVTTHDAEVARKLRLLRSHGISRDANEFVAPPAGPWDYQQLMLGFNCRMTDLQAALGLAQLSRLDFFQRQREALASRYDQMLANLPLRLPAKVADLVSAWHLYAVEIDPAGTAVGRARVFQAMRDAHIGVNVHYIPIHLQPHYAAMGFAPGQFPAAERYYAHALSLPLFPAMTELQQHRVVATLSTALAT